MSFLLPCDLPPDLAAELPRSSIGGGPDNMPWPTDILVESSRMIARRGVDESGFLMAPWDITGFGRLMGTSGTLIEREEPYALPLELARGKINQLRGQAAEWQAMGLEISPPLSDLLTQSSVEFGRAASRQSLGDSSLAPAALTRGYEATRQLVEEYIAQSFRARRQRLGRIDAGLGCRFDGRAIWPNHQKLIAQHFNEVCLSFAWNQVEPEEGTYRWEAFDALIDWARKQNLIVHAGPLLDFSARSLPDWLWLWRGDLTGVANFMCDYVTAVVKRYADRVHSWQLTAASNYANILGLGEDELLWLTARLIESARGVDLGLRMVVGIAQPWGEYMARDDRTHSPFIFADTLIRAGLNLWALDLEIVMGVGPRGSYCRDLLEVSRLLDLYSLLGVPLRVTLGYPSSSQPDLLADPEIKETTGYWEGGITPLAQRDWLHAAATLSLCKSFVRGVQWTHWSDAEPHQFPFCGLIDVKQEAKPALARLREIKDEYLV